MINQSYRDVYQTVENWCSNMPRCPSPEDIKPFLSYPLPVIQKSLETLAEEGWLNKVDGDRYEPTTSMNFLY